MSARKQMANTGKRSADNHGEMVSLCGDKITIHVFQKLMMESAAEKKHLH